MDARDRRLKKEAIVQAEAYLNRKRGYVTPQEKKAFRIAEKLRRGYWLESLSGLHSCAATGYSGHACFSAAFSGRNAQSGGLSSPNRLAGIC